jgi:transposase
LDHPTFSKNRQRVLEGNFADRLLSAVLSQLRVTGLLNTDHFSIDGTRIEA